MKLSSQYFCLVIIIAILVVFLFVPLIASAQVDNAKSFYQGSGYQCFVHSGFSNGLPFYDNGIADCSTVTGVFSRFLCSYEHIISDIMGDVYCSVLHALYTPLIAMLTLFITLFGVMTLTGQLPFTIKEGVMLLFKFTLVFTFATEADLILGLIYEGVMTFLKQGVTLTLSIMGQSLSGGGTSIMGSIDQIAEDAITSLTRDRADGDCQGAVIAMMFSFLISAPPITMLGLTMLLKLFMLVVQTLFTYLLAITSIMFLITMAPIFLSFALFKRTNQMFDAWAKHMISFALQVIIVMLFMAFILQLGLINEFTAYSDAVRSTEEGAKGTSFIRRPISMCTICEGGAKNAAGVFTCPGPGGVGVNPTEPSAIIAILAEITGDFAYLLILAYILEAMLKLIPKLSRILGQTRFSPELGNTLGNTLQGISSSVGSAARRFLNP